MSQEEIDGCREAFLAFDKDRSGTIGKLKDEKGILDSGIVAFLTTYPLLVRSSQMFGSFGKFSRPWGRNQQRRSYFR